MTMSRSAILCATLFLLALPALAAGDGTLPPHQPPAGWPHKGMTGTYDRAALQRGFQVYKEVCSACHGAKQLAYRNLAALGFNEAEVKAIAAEYKVTDGPNDQGAMYERAAQPADRFVGPFPNDQAARLANNGALPPDLSLIVKARKGHEDYIYSLLTGFTDPPVGVKVAEGMYYNGYFPGHQIAMPPPLSDSAVTYADGTKATVEQQARDVVQFLAWASEPEMEKRKQTGLKVLLFLAAFLVVTIAVKKRVWRGLSK